MAEKLRIPGKSVDTSAKVKDLGEKWEDLPFSIEVQEVVDVSAAREAGQAVLVELEPPEKIKTREAVQVCEVQLDEGITLWLRPRTLYRDFRPEGARAVMGEETGVWDITPAVSRPSTTRGGVTEQRIRQVTVYRYSRTRGLAGAVAGAAAEAVVSKVAGKFADDVAGALERHQLGHAPGLYRVEFGSAGEEKTVIAPVPDFSGESTILLFLHGTMSSFNGSFYGLWDPKSADGAEARQQLTRRYNHAYAWEHLTLTQSPIQNALELAQKLPDGAKLHLVSHSRGGLVGDLLCFGQQVDGPDALSPQRVKEIFRMAAGGGKGAEAYTEQGEDLAKLVETLKTKKVTVERYVRVACPAMGTTLASGKLDRWLSVVKLLNDMVLPYNFPLHLLIAVIAEHEDPREMPGLEAMMPGSPLVRTLNFPGLQVGADLSVISGDTDGKGIFGRLKELLLDQFFEDESDIVVNTGAMFGGLKRKSGGRFILDSGGEVNHFAYFKNPQTVRMLVSGLLRSDNSDGAFRPISEAPEKEPARALLRRAPTEAVPVVFVIPGIMGSTLKVADDRIWLAKLAIMLGRFGKLAFGSSVFPEEPFEEYYGDLLEKLRESHEVVPFPYDWRSSILDAGKELARQVSAKLDEMERRGSNQPVRIVAHSMGGLVLRAMMAQKPEVWRRMTAQEGSRVVMLGTPNGGSYEIVRLLTGYATVLQQLALLDFTRDWAELLEIIVRFPGVLELLPIENDFQYYKEEVWKELKDSDSEMCDCKVRTPALADLQQARRTWEVILATPLDSSRVFYVAGQASDTPVAWHREVIKDPEHIEKDRYAVVFEGTGRGDGRVPWESGIPLNVRTWFLPDVAHGDMPAHREAFPAYLELLQTGTTDRLPSAPPAGLRSAATEVRRSLPRGVPPHLPDNRHVVASALGATVSHKKGKRTPPVPKTKVSITHGDISYARYPVCVGHYAGDTIVSAENYLDNALGHRLRERVLLGLYPGKLGSCEVILNPKKDAKPAGAIVIGLGQVGELSPGSLETAFTQAVLQFALHVSECDDGRFGAVTGLPIPARLTTLLIGTAGGGILVRDSIEAILRGVVAAQRIIHERGLSSKICIDAVEFMELWQDVAIQAARDLDRALRDGDLEGSFTWQEGKVNVGEGGQQRILYEEAMNWWRRLEITYDEQRSALRFTAIADRARAERNLVTGDLQLADDLIKRTIGGTTRERQVARALFEMLIPNRLKEMAPHQYDVVLVVDEKSGRFPWELLENRWSQGDRPPAVSAGMLRQLKTDIFREQPVGTVEDTVFVVGDPVVTGTAAQYFPSLEGAKKEACAVADLLEQGGFVVTRQVRTDAQDIISGLHNNAYRILHLAGHGVHDQELTILQKKLTCTECLQTLPVQTKTVSGMVIGSNAYLTPGDVEQMRRVPELVFINCCHLGSLGGGEQNRLAGANHLAANLAAQFIRMGVKAVVAAGWAVDDAAAETFATTFYRHLLSGDNYGEAVRAARQETFDRHGITNTWGAYQCYGDPGFRLRSRAPKCIGAQRPKYVLPAQAVNDLRNLVNEIRMGSGCSERLEAIVQGIMVAEKAWLGRADVAAALGLAYGELRIYDKAIKHLDRALSGEKADFPVYVLECRASLKCRWAVELTREAKGRTPEAEKMLEDALADLEMLSKLTPAADTGERLSLVAAGQKRKAWIYDGEARNQALVAMRDNYRKAHEKRYDKTRNKLDCYPLLNWMAAEIVLSWYGVAPLDLGLVREMTAKARGYAEEMDRQQPSFWNSIVIPECILMLALAEMDLPAKKGAIINEYSNAKARGASPREFGSVMEHLEFLAEMMAGVENIEGMKQQATALQDIVAQLAYLAEPENGK